MKTLRTPAEKAPITTPQITALRKAKSKLYAKGDKKNWKIVADRLKQEINTFQLRQSNNSINKTKTGSRQWWSGVNGVTGHGSKNSQAPSHVYIDDNWYDIDTFCTNLNTYHVEIGGDVEQTTPNIESDLFVPEKVQVWEVYQSLKQINTRKATHSCDHPSWISYNNAELLAEPICNIINSVLQTGIYPRMWKSAEIAPIPKIDVPMTYKDFRPISLLYHLSKVTEKFINRSLSEYIPTDINQYAYTKNIGTNDALVKFITDIAMALDQKSTYGVQALYLDFSKAFDLMRADTLATKLKNLNVPAHLVRLILSFLSSRSQCVKFAGHSSPSLHTKTGVPQGTISGPTLWKIFVSDLNPSKNTIKYADDTTLYDTITKQNINVVEKSGWDRVASIEPNSIQEAANKALEWSTSNNQRLNAMKTQHMIFSLQLRVSVNDPITISGDQVKQSATAKLLGVTVDSHLKFADHVDMAIQKSRGAVHGLLTLRRHRVNQAMLIMYYQTKVIPILTYACPAWYTYITEESKTKLERQIGRAHV